MEQFCLHSQTPELEGAAAELCPAVWTGQGMVCGLVEGDKKSHLIALFETLAPGIQIEFAPPDKRDYLLEQQISLTGMEAGRFWVTGPKPDTVPDDKVALKIDSIYAFGSGHHNTTKRTLMVLDEMAGEPIGSVLDLGCGSGILSVAAGYLWPCPIVAADIDPRCVETTGLNATAHNNKQISAVLSDGFANPLLEEKGPYDLVIANILKNTLIELADQITTVTRRYLILSGLLVSQQEEVLAAYPAMTLQAEYHDEEWATLTLVK